MSFTRYLSRKIFGQYRMDPDRAQKWMAVMKVAYFFSASTLFIVYLKYRQDIKEKMSREPEKPFLEDISEGHKLMRTKGNQIGVLYNYTPGKGLERFDYNKEYYYQQLEKEAWERDQEAKKKRLEEGKELPPGAIKEV